ncbi:MAG: cobalamin-independent methionine synthase II family protein [SAR324 cluster bacterium]|nr:cobalamin-independent methionine synthase II family protein [SAR324 cluster bacterium]
MITAHADVVGSLLRPPALLEARQRLDRGRMDPAAFKAIEDRAVDEAVALQEAAGLEVATDGEMRRLSFQSQMTEAVDGFGQWDLDAFLWGQWRGEASVGDRAVERPATLGVMDKLRPRRHLCAEEFTYLRARTRVTPKVCLPSPSLWANFWSPRHSRGAYPSLDAFLADVTDILRAEVAELVRLGANYIQLDAPHYTALLDPHTRAFYEDAGWPMDKWLSQGVALDNAVMDGFPGITFAFHLCRGNQASRWLVEGGYEAIAAPIFRNIRAQRLFLEYDDARSGSFEPLQAVPEDKVVVLGLVTTKSPRRETAQGLAARIEEAARYLPLERLALSPQCGFSTSILGNRLTPRDQQRKLEVVVETARRVWG